MHDKASFTSCLFIIILCTASGCSRPTTGNISPLETSSPLPTPLPGKAIVRGRILTSPTAILGELYLAKAVPTSNPDIDLLELDESQAPRALINRNTGEFAFINVAPGKYGIIAWEPMSSAPISDPMSKETLFIELRAGQVADLGELYFP